MAFYQPTATKESIPILLYVFYFAIRNVGADAAVGHLPIEVCNGDVFNTSCPTGYVIMVASAVYGRMRLGGCVKKDFGEIGCHANATVLMDKECTGRRRCNVEIPTPGMKLLHGCSDELSQYLSVQYQCVPEISSCSGNSSCSEGRNLLIGSEPWYISHMSLTSLNVGRCQYQLSAGLGQHIRITHYQTMGISMTLERHTCLKVGNVSSVSPADSGVRRVTSDLLVCGWDDSRRERIIYTAHQHDILLELDCSVDGIFLKVEATGCADIKETNGVIFQRVQDYAILSCHDTSNRTVISCIGNKWEDKIPMCSLLTTEIPKLGLVMLVSIGVAIGVFLGGVFLVMFNSFMRRKIRDGAKDRNYADSVSVRQTSSNENAAFPGGLHVWPLSEDPSITSTGDQDDKYASLKRQNMFYYK